MTKNGEEVYVNRCLLLIELKLAWGASDGWVNYDYEKLSDTIHESTGVQLSVTTLKRIWGKLKYESAPTLTTLNALAQFAGYEDWRSFKQKEIAEQESDATTEVIPSAHAVTKMAPAKRGFHYYWLLLIVPFLLLGYVLIPAKPKAAATPVDGSLFSFRADKIVTEGVPNSVVFHYDAKAAKTDSVFIAQTWDVSRKKLVPKDGTAHSAIYYYPGFFQSKLIVDNITVKTHDIRITSDGWLCLAENDPIPLYFKKEECIKNNVVEVNEQTLKNYHLPLYPTPPRIRFFNQRDLGDLMNDNFIFETSLKNDLADGSNACQPVQVMIQCKNDIIIIPLVAKACIGNIGLLFCGYSVSSAEADLSGFGADLTQWTHLRIETKDKKATIYINNKLAYLLTFPNAPTGIAGVQYRFNGTGAVKDTRFLDNGKVINF